MLLSAFSIDISDEKRIKNIKKTPKVDIKLWELYCL